MLNEQERTSIIFEWLYSQSTGFLRRFEIPDHLDADGLRSEINFIVSDMNAQFEEIKDQTYMNYLLESAATEIRQKHRGRKWPTIQEFCAAVRKAQSKTDSNDEKRVDYEMLYDGALRWWKRLGDKPCYSPAIVTQMLIDRGDITAIECFKMGMDMEPETYRLARNEALPWFKAVLSEVEMAACDADDPVLQREQNKNRNENRILDLKSLVDVNYKSSPDYK